jgi:hypothetical protein
MYRLMFHSFNSLAVTGHDPPSVVPALSVGPSEALSAPAGTAPPGDLTDLWLADMNYRVAVGLQTQIW